MDRTKLDNLIKDGLKKISGSSKIEKTMSCPSEIELIDYLHGLLPEIKEKSIAEHIRSCYWCIEQLDQAQRAESIGDMDKKTSLRNKIKTNLINWIKKNKWLSGAAITFILSFIFPRYFLQFLILTLLMGIKWIFSTGGTKTIIMIYDALRRKDRGERPKATSNDRFNI